LGAGKLRGGGDEEEMREMRGQTGLLEVERDPLDRVTK
jgi:hypothetical protein